MDGVFSLQRAGTDAVFAYQYPVAVAAAGVIPDAASTRRRRRLLSKDPPAPPITKPAPLELKAEALLLPGLLPDLLNDVEEDDEAAVMAATVLMLS